MTECVIYIDVLIGVNIFINYFLLISTSMFTSQKPKCIRTIIGAVVGGFQSLIILVNINPIILFLIKLVFLGLIIIITYKIKSVIQYIKTVLIFLGVNFVFAGVITAIWYLVTPSGMLLKNGIVYFDISPLFLLITTVIAYFILRLIELIINKSVNKRCLYQMKIENNNKVVELTALYDTGNSIVDSISGYPVTVCEFDAISSLLSYEEAVNISEFMCKGNSLNSNLTTIKGFRLVPYSVVNSSGLLVCFAPDKIYVKQNDEYKEISCEIGLTRCKISQGEFQAIINAKALCKI